ncbi:MAG: hypothetical protein WC260_00210 [Candidatus Pacearchaeota archaeon]
MKLNSTEKRKTKKDLKRKRQYRVYKKGGKYRTINLEKIEEQNKSKSKDD